MMELMVDLGQRAYPIRIGEGALALLTQGNESAFGDQYHRRTAL